MIKCYLLNVYVTFCFQEIPLSEILSVDSNLEPMGSRHGRNPYLFTLKTNTTIYHCGERDDFDDNGTLIPANPKSGKGTRIAIAWADDIKSAYQPVSINQQDVMMQQHPKPPSPEPGEEASGKQQEVELEEASQKVDFVLNNSKGSLAKWLSS